jgi:hypothetical protein
VLASGAYPLGHGRYQAVASARPDALLPLAGCCGGRWWGLGGPPIPKPSLSLSRSRSCRAIDGPKAGATEGQVRPSRTGTGQRLTSTAALSCPIAKLTVWEPRVGATGADWIGRDGTNRIAERLRTRTRRTASDGLDMVLGIYGSEG